MSDLITVPNFIFHQVDSDGCHIENPIRVCFYNGSISLDHPEENITGVTINPECFKQLVKEINKHRPEAERMLSNRK